MTDLGDHPTTASAEPAAPVVDEQVDLLDLDAIGRELAGVEHALRRLDEGTYWTDEVTGAPIPLEILESNPTARRAVS